MPLLNLKVLQAACNILSFAVLLSCSCCTLSVPRFDGKAAWELKEDFTFDISPDGSSVVFVQWSEQGPELVVIEIASGISRKIQTPADLIPKYPRFSPDSRNILFIGKHRTESPRFESSREVGGIRNTNPPYSAVFLSDGIGPAHEISSEGLILEADFGPRGDTIYYLKAKWYGAHSPLTGSNRPHGIDLHVLDLKSGISKAVTSGEYYYMYNLRVAPDGQRAFVAGATREGIGVISLSQGSIGQLNEVASDINSIRYFDIIDSNTLLIWERYQLNIWERDKNHNSQDRKRHTLYRLILSTGEKQELFVRVCDGGTCPNSLPPISGRISNRIFFFIEDAGAENSASLIELDYRGISEKKLPVTIQF